MSSAELLRHQFVRKVAEVERRDRRVQWLEESATRDLLFVRALTLVSVMESRQADRAVLSGAGRQLAYGGANVRLSPSELVFMQRVASKPDGTIKTWLSGASRSLLTGRDGRPGLHQRFGHVGLRIRSGQGLLALSGGPVSIEVAP